MKTSALLLTLVTSLVLVPVTLASVKNDIKVSNKGGGSSVNVKVSNNVGDSSNTVTRVESNSKTNVEIHQSGEGNSEVKVNDKEWKLNGPGNISVSEESHSTATPHPTMTGTPKPTTSPTPTASPTVSPSPSPAPTSNPMSGMIKALENLLAKLKSLF